MTSLSSKARVAGLLYIGASLVGFLRLIYVPRVLFVHGNAGATVANLAAHETLFRLGIATYLISAAVFVLVTLALYRLLKEVDRGLAMAMVILGGVIPAALFFVNSATDVAALLLARGGTYLSALGQAQRQALAMLSLDLHHHLDLANAIFWGLWLVPYGLLVYRSRFLPRVLGVWLIIGCLGWLAYALAGILQPGREEWMFRMTQPLTLGELATMLWLAILGATEPRPAGS